MIYFTSDTHFGHVNILKYCNRPFSSVEDMNEKLCERWNARVGSSDTVYHLGDFAMGQKQNVYIRKKLNGKIILVKGNHDRSDSVMLDAGFDEVHRSLLIDIDGFKVYMAHIPVHFPDPTERSYDPSLVKDPPPYYDYFLCGHVHQQWKRKGNTINVGADVSDYRPLTFAELLVRDV